MFCTHCGQQVSDQTAFCPICGSPIVAKPAPSPGNVCVPKTRPCPPVEVGISRSTTRTGAIALLIMSAIIAVMLFRPAISFPFVYDLEQTTNQLTGLASDLSDAVLGTETTGTNYTEDFSYSMFDRDELVAFFDDPSGLLFGVTDSFAATQGIFLIAWIVCLGLIGISSITLLVTKGRTSALSLIAFGTTFATTLSWCLYVSSLNSAFAQVMSTYQAIGSLALGSVDTLLDTTTGGLFGDACGSLMPGSAYVSAPLFGPKAVCVISALAFLVTLLIRHSYRKATAIQADVG